MEKGPTAIDCSVRLSVMEIQVCKKLHISQALRAINILRLASRNTLMARNAREICNFFAHLYLHNE